MRLQRFSEEIRWLVEARPALNMLCQNSDRCVESLSESIAACSSEGVADVPSKRRNDGGRTGASGKRSKEGEVSRGGVATGMMGALCFTGMVRNSGTQGGHKSPPGTHVVSCSSHAGAAGRRALMS